MITFNPNAGPISAIVTVAEADIAGQLAYLITNNANSQTVASAGGIDLVAGGNTIPMLSPASANHNMIVEAVVDFTGINEAENGKQLVVKIAFSQGGTALGTATSTPVTVDGSGQNARAFDLLQSSAGQPA